MTAFTCWRPRNSRNERCRFTQYFQPVVGKMVKRRQPNSKVVSQRRRRTYPGFPEIPMCWEQSADHKRYFITYAGCKTLQHYHTNRRACKPFDDLVRRWAGPKNKTEFFNYYKVVGTLPTRQSYLTEALPTRTRRLNWKFADLNIVKKTICELETPPPAEYEDWPPYFTMEAVSMNDAESEKEMLESIEMCLKQRLIFRNVCVEGCSTLIDTRSHDDFMLILNILRARLLKYAT